MVEQHVQLALEVADEAIVLVHGSVVTAGPPPSLAGMPPLSKPLTLRGGEAPPIAHPGTSTASPVLIDEMSTGLAPVVVDQR